jgi:prevent-host-death family protein
MEAKMSETNAWKLQDAKARFSELVRRARTGEPQRVMVRGKDVVVVVDPRRFEIRAKPQRTKSAPLRTLAGFVEASKRYRGAAEGVEFEPKLGMSFRDKRAEIFDVDFLDED